MEQSGRTQLRDALKDLISQTKDNNKEENHPEVDQDVEEAARELMEYSSPRKRTYKQRRKRKRTQRDSISDTFSDEERETSSSEVISIYGRHLNLSRLGKTPSLYSICRDWVLNDPLGQSHLMQQSLSQSNVSEFDENGIYKFPPPEVQKSHHEIPKSHIDSSVMDKNLIAGIKNDEMPLLKKDYLQKWKKCCARTKEMSRKAQQRHHNSLKLLREIHQR